MIRVIIAALLVMCSAVLSLAQTSPLIMKHADNLDVARNRGFLLLQGNVHFVHDSVTFKTQRATWNRDAEEIQCEGGFLMTHPNGYIKARTGNYQKKKSIAYAIGDVRAADSAKTYMLTGEKLIYDKAKEILTLPEKPKLYQFDHQKDGKIDTVTIEAKRLIFNKAESFAEAYEKVKITQKEMTVTCDTGYFDRKNNWLAMKGNPMCEMKNYHLSGDSIFLVLDSAGKSLKSALVIRNAHGVQQEEGKRNGPGSVTEAFGDTLYAEFSGQKIERLYVNLNAKGFFYETDLPDYRNLMDGDRLDFYFNKGKMDHAVVSGKAKSTYFYIKPDRSVSGKNEAAGDTINIIFDPIKNAVKSLRLLGASNLASGRYVDMEKDRRNKEAKEREAKLAAEDSLKMAKAASKDSVSTAEPAKRDAVDSETRKAKEKEILQMMERSRKKREREELKKQKAEQAPKATENKESVKKGEKGEKTK